MFAFEMIRLSDRFGFALILKSCKQGPNGCLLLLLLWSLSQITKSFSIADDALMTHAHYSTSTQMFLGELSHIFERGKTPRTNTHTLWQWDVVNFEKGGRWWLNWSFRTQNVFSSKTTKQINVLWFFLRNFVFIVVHLIRKFIIVQAERGWNIQRVCFVVCSVDGLWETYSPQKQETSTCGCAGGRTTSLTLPTFRQVMMGLGCL